MNINLSLLGQMITFGILVWVTCQYIWPVLIETIDTRRREIAAKLQEAEEALVAKDGYVAQGQKSIKDAEAKARRILALAEERAARVQADARHEAGRETKRMVALAEDRIADEYSKAQAHLNNQVSALAMQAARQILQKSLGGDKAQDQLLDILVEN